MIPTRQSYEAVFTNKDGNTTWTMPVEAWSNHGEPMVLRNTGVPQLVPANTLPGFAKVDLAERQPIVGVLPGGDWDLVLTDSDGELIDPVLGWAITATGEALPIGVFESEGVGDIHQQDNISVRRRVGLAQAPVEAGSEEAQS